MKIHWKRDVKILAVILISWLIYQFGFFTGERESPNAYFRNNLNEIQKAYINCSEKLKNYDLNF